MADFFISYRGTDVQWAQWIAWQLQQAGSEVIYQAADFRAGPPLIDLINQAVTSARCTIAVISPAYFESPWCKLEWQTAHTLDVKDSTRRLLLVMIQPTALPHVLRANGWVELAGLDEAAAKKRLLTAAHDQTKPIVLPPNFPGVGFGDAVARRMPVAPKSIVAELISVTPPDHFPGRSKIWNVPHPWNPNFVGRDGLLAELRNSLLTGDRATVTQAVTGLPGVGKTQLATKYAYQHAADYELIWWVNSDSPAGLATNFTALAGPLGLPEQDERDLNVKAQAVRRRLAEISSWLIIFDNVEDPQHLIGYLPQNTQGHVIITSRHPHWRQMAKALVVPTLARADSIRLLQRRSGQRDPVAAAKLAELLGDLPVALAQAAAYIERADRTLAAYLDLFQQHRGWLWKQDKPPDSYQRIVVETVALTWENLTQHSRAAADLLQLCAYLAPDKIPLDILTQHADQVEGRLDTVFADAVELDAALVELRGYSLVEVTDRQLSLHCLVQAVVRERLPLTAQQAWCAAAIGVLHAAFPEGGASDPNAWPLCDLLVDHVLHATEHAAQLNVAPDQAVRLAAEADVYLEARAQYGGAEVASRRALYLATKAFGLRHERVATCLNNLAWLLKKTNRLAEAEPLLCRALAIDVQSLDPQHPHVAIRLKNLARLLQDTNRLGEAEPLLRGALAILVARLGDQHPNTVRVRGNLEQLLEALGKTGEKMK